MHIRDFQIHHLAGLSNTHGLDIYTCKYSKPAANHEKFETKIRKGRTRSKPLYGQALNNPDEPKKARKTKATEPPANKPSKLRKSHRLKSGQKLFFYYF